MPLLEYHFLKSAVEDVKQLKFSYVTGANAEFCSTINWIGLRKICSGFISMVAQNVKTQDAFSKTTLILFIQ